MDCPFCSKEMRRGTTVFGAGLNSVTFSCDNCGALSISYRHLEKRVKSFKTSDFEFEDLKSENK